MSDDSVTKFAQRFRLEAAATLVAVCRDESAPASARAVAAKDILSYSDGKPGQAKPVTVADVAAMSDDQRQELLNALLNHYTPGGSEALLRDACNEAVRQYQQTITAHQSKRRNR